MLSGPGRLAAEYTQALIADAGWMRPAEAAGTAAL
jgi:hypothetical protein